MDWEYVYAICIIMMMCMYNDYMNNDRLKPS